MDQMLEKESAKETERRIRKRRRSVHRIAGYPLPGFLGRLGDDVRWYYDVRLWLPLFLLLLIIAWLPGKEAPKPAVDTPETIEMQETEPADETEPEVILVNSDAEVLARLADSVGAGRSNNVKTIIMWVAINRSEDRANGYGLTLAEEAARPNQWQFYDENITYSEETYQIALDVLATVENEGLRPLDNDMLWFVLNDNGSITVRNRFTATANQKWNEKTVK